MSIVMVTGGDVHLGAWTLNGVQLKWSRKELIDLPTQMEACEPIVGTVIKTQNAVGRAVVGGLLFGVVGAAVGAASASKGNASVTFGVKLRSGSRFVATTDPETWERIKKILFLGDSARTTMLPDPPALSAIGWVGLVILGLFVFLIILLALSSNDEKKSTNATVTTNAPAAIESPAPTPPRKAKKSPRHPAQRQPN